MTWRLNGVGDALPEKSSAADDLFSRIYSEPRERSLRFARPQSSQQIGALFMFEKISLAGKYSGKRHNAVNNAAICRALDAARFSVYIV
ncbi:hypothetical protein BG60_12320 [Caballeronia zhejiangensis]|uniref:Uncharacterized protein n=1 Tax=Caballeronia zhejiangensis TaxID=871203 RepID=A0A656QSS1_9BURK|nr:hypothetical protein BURK_028445 [Burkholderia sp. SJ98]KDR33275.1 hypothetical protein BG60_12320 [Caballeronia zhejiangensis]